MKAICGWCGEELRIVASERPSSEEVVTHGICKECVVNFLAQLGMPLPEYIETLAWPVVVMDPNGVVRAANSLAYSLLQKDSLAVVGYNWGDVFECKYARLPEGCGHTIHCNGCTIRRTVVAAFETGQDQIRVPACLNRWAPDGTAQIQFLISTQKVGSIVLLTIDEIG